MLRWLRRGQGNGAGAAAVVKATAYESAGDVADEDLRAKLEAARLRQEKAEKEERRRRKGRARQTAKDAGPVKETKVEVETQLEEDAAKLMARRRTIVEEGAGVAMPTRQSPPPSPDAANPELVEKLSRARAHGRRGGRANRHDSPACVRGRQHHARGRRFDSERGHLCARAVKHYHSQTWRRTAPDTPR